MPILVQLVGMWVARDIAAGRYPAKIAVPLSILVARIGAPGLLLGALGFAFNHFADRAISGESSPRSPRRRRPATTRKAGATRSRA